VRLLFDENLSPRLVQTLEPEYPGSAHVRTLGLRGATDEAIWERARQEGYAIISKDNDFRQLSFLHDAPPKVIWLSVGNAGTEAILRLLRSRRAEIEAFEADTQASLLVLALTESAV
jgi:predicted nuclease of predicted toxin-antitoxin system